MNLDPEKVTNTPEEMLRQAILMQQAQQEQPGPDPQPQGQMDMTGGGGGQVGVGAAAVPGEEQFTGNLQEPPPGAGLPPGLG